MSYETDLNNMQLLEEIIEYDPTADLNPSISVPDGTYLAELSMGKFGVEVKAPKGGGAPYLNVSVSGKIIAPGERYDGFRVSGFVKSTVFESSGTSLLHQMLKSLGAAVPARCTLGDIKNIVEQVLSGNPQCKGRTRWEASCQDSTPGVWHRVRGMKNFPTRADGTHDPHTTIKLSDGSEVPVEGRPTWVDFYPASNSASYGTIGG